MLDRVISELDIKSVGFVLFSILLWSLAFQHLVGVFKRELYSANTLKKEGISAIIWGLGYFLLFASFGSSPLLIFSDYGYDQVFLLGLSTAVLIISLPLGFLYERYLRLNYLPIYDEEQAAKVAYQHLPSALQSLLSEDDVKLILEKEFEYQQKIGLVGKVADIREHRITIDEQDLRIFIVDQARKQERHFTVEQVAAVLNAEDAYLKQIEVLGNRNNPKSQPKALNAILGTGLLRVIMLVILLVVLISGRVYIIAWFNDALFIKESVFREKISFNITLEVAGYFDELQHSYPKYINVDNKALMQVAFAQYFLDQKKFDEALNYIKKAINLNNKFLPAYTTYGHYFFDKNDYMEAIEKYQMAVTIDPDHHIAYASLGWMHDTLGEIERAIGYYNKSLSVNPKYGLVYGYFVAIYTEKGEYEKAIESYHKALRYGADYAFVHYNAALTYKALNNLEEARNALGRSLDKNPKNIDEYILKAEIDEQEGKIDEAISLMERTVKDYPQALDAYEYLAILYISEGFYKEAIKTYQSAINIETEQKSKAIIYENLGLVYHNNTRQFDLAEEAFKNALDNDPKQATIHLNLGETYRAKGKLKEAEDQQRIALQLAPENALVHNNLGYSLALQGKITEAIAEFNKALEIDPNLKIAKENLEIFKKK